MSSIRPDKIASLEMGRVIAMFAIILLHCHTFLWGPFVNETPWVGYIINQFTRFAVPFFFILSGYLIQPKLSISPLLTLKRYSLPLLKIWLIWSIICLAMPFNWEVLFNQGYMADRQGYWNWLMTNPLNTFMEGGLVHLWFIPALICAVAILALCIYLNMSVLLPFIAAALYIYGVLGGSYGQVTEIWTPFMTRNGPFFSTLLVWLGFEIRRKSFSLSFNTALIIALAGMAIHFAEAFFLTQYDVVFNTHDFLFGTSLWGIGIFMMLLNKPEFGNHPLTFSLAKNVLGIYVVHLPIAVVIYNATATYELTGYAKDITLLGGTLILTSVFIGLVSRSKVQKLLFR